MDKHHCSQFSQADTTCGSLLFEIQKLWDEIGEDDHERDRLLFELEQECLDAYRRKVEQASRCRAQLRQAVADSEAQLADICAALGERPAYVKKSHGSLKKELETIMPQLENMKKKIHERKSQFAEVLNQINSISMELSRSTETNLNAIAIDESDLSLKRFNDLQNQLLSLQKEKDERVKQVRGLLNTQNSLYTVLGMDFKSTAGDICDTQSLSLDTIQSLSATISRLKDVKLQRMQRLQDLAIIMVELWTLMDTPIEEQQMFHNVTRTIAASEDEITDPNALSLESINNAEVEVKRLQERKSIKMKEVLLKKKSVLDEICQGAHMVIEGQLAANLSEEAIESGAISSDFLLEELEIHICKAKEEAFSREEILEKVKKWLAACEEECWLEEYSRDENRYNAGRGTHLMLKRAEKARILVNKIPAMVEGLKSKVRCWETDRGVKFLYDGVGLQSMLDQYCDLKHLKEQERQRQRDQKKILGQLNTEKEAIYGSKPSPKSGNKNFRPSIGGAGNKRFSVGGAMLQSMAGEKTAPSSSLIKNNSATRQPSSRIHHQNSCGKNNMPGGTVKQHSKNTPSLPHPSSLSMRKPLSPLSSLSSNIASLSFQDQNAKSGEFRDKSRIALSGTPTKNVLPFDENQTPKGTPTKNVLPFDENQTPKGTPTKNVSSFDENTTPKMMPIPMPKTPPTSMAMQTAMTPFTPGGRGKEDAEYSYEERRAGFILPKSLPQLV